jgi:hypothetical protein
MTDNGKGVVGEPEVTGEQIRQAWEYAAVAAMDSHRDSGVPVTTWDWENQRIVVIPAQDLPTYETHDLVGQSPVEGKS